MVDTNVVLRYLVGSRSPSDDVLYVAAGVLFEHVERGVVHITTNDAVVGEVAFILHAPRHYGLARNDVASRLRTLFAHPTFVIPGKSALLESLSLWAATPSLSFVDALTIARACDGGHDLATFDAAMARHAGVPIWQPDPA